MIGAKVVGIAWVQAQWGPSVVYLGKTLYPHWVSTRWSQKSQENDLQVLIKLLSEKEVKLLEDNLHCL